MENPHFDPDKKVEHTLVKSRSRNRYEFVTCIQDDWFIYVNRVENKTNTLLSYSIIIRKDKEGWLRYMTGMQKWYEKISWGNR
jgi:hypothetical protein